MNLNELRDEAYSIAKANGWHEEEHSDEHWLILVISEIAEAVQADRKNQHADIASFKEYQTYYGSFLPSKETLEIRFREDFEAYIKNSVEEELSDVVIRCLDIAGLHGIDIEAYPIEIVPKSTFTEHCFYLCKVLSDGDRNPKEDWLKNTVDTVISYILSYCEEKGIDIDFFIRTKMNYNRLRGYHHGGKRY